MNLAFCSRHWHSLPIRLRQAIWREFEVGVACGHHPTDEYALAFGEALRLLHGKELAKR